MGCEQKMVYSKIFTQSNIKDFKILFLDKIYDVNLKDTNSSNNSLLISTNYSKCNIESGYIKFEIQDNLSKKELYRVQIEFSGKATQNDIDKLVEKLKADLKIN